MNNQPPRNNNAVPPSQLNRVPFNDDELENDADSNVSSTSSDLSDGQPYPAVDGSDDPSSEDEGNETDDNEVPRQLPVLRGLRSQYNPQRMVLSAEERQWAIALKEHIDMIPGIDNPTDYWLAQTAMVCGGDLAKGVWRLGRMMEFRADKYNISDEETYDWTPDQAMEFIEHGFIRAFPGLVLFFHFCPEEETYVLGYDLSKCELTQYRISEQRTQEAMKAYYFLLLALTADLETVRKGIVTMVEWAGVGWSYNADIQFGCRIAADLVRPFPMNRKKVKNYHTGAATNALVRILKSIFPRRIARKFDVDCELDGRLDAVFMVPTPEAATERMLGNIKEALQHRHRNERYFTLNHPLSWQIQQNQNNG